MEEAFGILVFAVVAGAVIVGLITLAGSGDAYRQIGRGAMTLDDDDEGPARHGGGSAPDGERDDEIRQMLAARNARRARRGEAPIDVEAEAARLCDPAAPWLDAGLRREVRDLVLARNARRVRTGEQPLDVDAEVERRLRDLT